MKNLMCKNTDGKNNVTPPYISIQVLSINQKIVNGPF